MEKFASCSFANDFHSVTILQRSSIGIVYKATFRYDNQVYVLKERKLAELGRQKDMLNEVKLLQQLHHPNIVQCKGWFRDIDKGCIYIVLEYCECGDLHSYIQSHIRAHRQFSEQQIWFIFIQLLRGVQHIHENGIIHRDLKTLNVFITKDYNTYKIGDLGVSRQVSEFTELVNTFYGTPLYLSPELIENKAYNEKTDIWSLGVILYELCTLSPPFKGPTLMHLAKSVLSGVYEPLPSTRSKHLGKVVAWLLTLDFRKRPHIKQVLEYVESKQTKLPRAINAPPPPEEQEQQPAVVVAPAAAAAAAVIMEDEEPCDEDSLDGDQNNRNNKGHKHGGIIVGSKVKSDSVDERRKSHGRIAQVDMGAVPETVVAEGRAIGLAKSSSEKLREQVRAAPRDAEAMDKIPIERLAKKDEREIPPKAEDKPSSKAQMRLYRYFDGIDLQPIEITFPIAKLLQRLKKENGRYRRLLQMRAYREDNGNADLEEELGRCQRNLVLLETSVSKEGLISLYHLNLIFNEGLVGKVDLDINPLLHAHLNPSKDASDVNTDPLLIRKGNKEEDVLPIYLQAKNPQKYRKTKEEGVFRKERPKTAGFRDNVDRLNQENKEKRPSSPPYDPQVIPIYLQQSPPKPRVSKQVRCDYAQRPHTSVGRRRGHEEDGNRVKSSLFIVRPPSSPNDDPRYHNPHVPPDAPPLPLNIRKETGESNEKVGDIHLRDIHDYRPPPPVPSASTKQDHIKEKHTRNSQIELETLIEKGLADILRPSAEKANGRNKEWFEHKDGWKGHHRKGLPTEYFVDGHNQHNHIAISEMHGVGGKIGRVVKERQAHTFNIISNM